MQPNQFLQIFNNPLTTLYYLAVSIILSLSIAYTYRKTHKGISYSQSFVTSLVMLLPLVSLIINIVNNNVARAIGVFGAFSITRFRTPIKDSRDMIYIFWSLATGLSIGSGEIGIAISATLFMVATAFILHWTNYGIVNQFDYLLIYNLKTQKNQIEKVNNKIDRLSKAKEILNIQSDKKGEYVEVSLNLKLKKGIGPDQIISQLQTSKGVSEISITPTQNTAEF